MSVGDEDEPHLPGPVAAFPQGISNRARLGVHSGVDQRVAAVLQCDQARSDGYRTPCIHHSLDTGPAEHSLAVEWQCPEPEHREDDTH